jgi:hypothetical protein
MPGDQHPTVDPVFERERWAAELKLREREIKLKENEQKRQLLELRFKLREERRSRWANPLVLAVLAAALAAAGNAAVAYLNGSAQRALEQTRGDQQLEIERSKATAQERLEETKAEANRVLEVIKTDDPAKAIVNLRFMLDTGLITNESRRQAMSAYLSNLKPGQGPVLPSPSFSPPLVQSESVQTECTLPAGGTDVAKLSAAFGESLKSNPLNLQVRSASAADGLSMLADDPGGHLRLAIGFSKERENITVRWSADYRASAGPTKVVVPVGQLSQTLLDRLKVILETAGAASPSCRVSVRSG